MEDIDDLVFYPLSDLQVIYKKILSLDEVSDILHLATRNTHSKTSTQGGIAAGERSRHELEWSELSEVKETIRKALHD